ncbi:MAG TPA: universal stress protein [Ktedonobacterales bacterium]|jgi:nucleotide-binding universal stress UspA family protein
MYKRILVPLDGSLRAERALPLAADLARAGSGEVILASVVTEPTYLRREEDQPPTAEAVLAGERETAMRSVEDVSQRLELAGVTTQMEVRVAPTVAPALLDIMQMVHADLVIMCSHGRTGFQRWTLGSVAQKITRQATVPTLVLRADGPDLMRATGDGPRSVCALVPLDGSSEAEMALEPAARLVSAVAAPGQGALHLLHVVQLEDATHTALNARQSLQQEAECYLRQVAERLALAPLASLSLTVSWSVIFDPDVAAAVLEQSTDHGCDMIAMGSHGRSGFQLWALGSVTERVLQSTALPLLIVRSDSATTQLDACGAKERQVDHEMLAWPGYEPTQAPTKTPTR